jgi:oxygen-independent coproporphyrinogen-3 oxidase
VRAGQLSTGRGHVFKGEDRLRARLIEALMCDFRIDSAEIRESFGVSDSSLDALYKAAEEAFPAMVSRDAGGFSIKPEGRALARLIARNFDEYEMREEGYSSAI